MPELPEVETVKRGLARLLPGLVITKIEFNWPKSFPNSDNDVDRFIIGAKILEINRRGKALIVKLDTDYSLITHLKMTGQLVFRGQQNFGAGHPNDSLIGNLPDKSTRVVLSFNDRSKLFFNDQRKFGWMRLFPSSEVENLDFFKKMGPEPLDGDFNASKMAVRLLRRPNSVIKAVLLDQTIIAGVGNIYADEALWGAKIHPKTLVRNLTPAKLRLLHKELITVLALSIEKGGSTDRNYVDADGKKGSYLAFAKVFRRESLPCPRCGDTIIKLRVAGRGTHICPHCQKEVT